MYIPLTYLGDHGNLCISASGGDSIGYVLQDSALWKYHSFTSPGNHTYTIHSGSALHKVVLVGAGGGGGISVDLGDRFGGGGGAGGFLFLENLPFNSGSYNLYVGSGSVSQIIPNGYTCTVSPFAQSDSAVSYPGQSTTLGYSFQPTSPDPGYYIPSSTLIAYGGPQGSNQYRICPANGTSTGTSGGDGASGGGGSYWSDGSGNKIRQSGIALYNLTDLPPHGFDGGPVIDNSTIAGAGGGGASTSGSSQNVGGPNYGGAGVDLLSYIGISQTVCVGGPGGNGVGSSYTNPSFTSGSGGGAAKDTDTATQISQTKGQNGLVILMYKVCSIEFQQCNTYSVFGGASGGNITFLPCGIPELQTISVDPLDVFTFCGYPIPGYPSVSGTVTATITGSCDTYIEPANPESCPTGSVLTPMYITEIDIVAAGVGPYPGYICFEYTDYLGNIQSECRGTGVYDVCAQSGSIQITSQTTGVPTTFNTTYTNIQCGNYCSGSI